MDDVLSSISRSPPDLIGMSLFSFEGIPPYTGLMKDSSKLSETDLAARTAGLVDVLAEAIDKIRQATIHNACGLPLTPLKHRVPLVPPLSRSRQNVVDLISSKRDLVSARKNVLLVDEVGLAAQSGGLRAAGKAVFSRARRTTGRIPHLQFRTHFGGTLFRRAVRLPYAWESEGAVRRPRQYAVERCHGGG